MARVLVVDDDPDVAASVVRALRIAGHDAVSASDAPDALVRIAEAPPDLLITDIVMPGMDGLSLVMEVRRRAPLLPVIAMSGGGGLGFRDEFLALAEGLGAAVLGKPFINADLLAAVARATGKS